MRAISITTAVHEFLTAAIASAVAGGALISVAFAQAPAGQRPMQASDRAPVEVALPRLSVEVTGPGAMFDSTPSHPPGHRPEDYDFATREYFASGTADGRPYTTRVVVRMPSDASRFTGLIVAESMHSSGSAHGFEFNAMYVMDAGHAAVEILTTSPQQFVDFNAARYEPLRVADGQTNEILAQVGALLKSERSPLGQPARRIVLWGTSMSAATLINYLPDHSVYRRPGGERIYDGFIPTSTGATIIETDVPLIQIPTMHEIETNVPRRQDSDEPGRQYRLYELAGLGHLDTRDNVRLMPNPCAHELSSLPLQAYIALGLHHMFRWVDEGIAPPRAQRVLLDRNVDNDGSMALLDEHGNPIGGVRNPYVDVPAARYVPVNTPAEPPIPNPSEWIQANQPMGAAIMCRLGSYQERFPRAKLHELYGSRENYLREFEARLHELEAEGWSLPAYRELILSDAREVEF